jgi:hypothetical protein
MSNVLLPISHVNEICRIGQRSATCRYLGGLPGEFCCLKHSDLKDLIDERVANNTMTAQGDNCEGFKEQT